MFDEEEYVKRYRNLPNTNIRKNDDGEYEFYQPLEADLMTYSFFIIVRLVLGMALVTGFIMLFIDFSESISGFIKKLIAYTV